MIFFFVYFFIPQGSDNYYTGAFGDGVINGFLPDNPTFSEYRISLCVLASFCNYSFQFHFPIT